ncbi:Copper-transporting ATPase PAA1, chloroplastic [Auxenochlorella protothecoides]|uniref:Copper-transporting ATPase PAA1, chloroplastic n=1 Tax=Auxenochlorella protothecoides TaxID=3075 RepID=A0A087SN32_AUXPR|nr:Copper-transporting ATPase PAA1, chloroplastic [Auxenochlorella protothecoides]KFM27136.1 Copper-transporting ATPase PAA1, chloroplastic [Auxenochlorella protothecoides]
MYRRNAQLIGLGVRVVNRSLGGGLGGRTPRPPLGGKGWRGSRQPLPSPSSTGQGDAPAAPPGTTREDVVLLDVDGMHCAGCVSRVRKLLEDQPAVRGASVSLATETALARVRLATPSHSSTGSKADELEKSGGEALNGGGGALEALGASLAQDPAMLLGVVLAGRTAEERARLRAASDMLALQGLLPDSARLLLGDGSLRDVPAHAVARGDAVVVLPGDVVPVDGVVAEGRSACDESSLTGEAMPVPKAKGQRVSAGTLNSEGRLVVVAEAAGEATTLGALGVLVVACPCALGLAAPTAVLVGSSAAARHGLLIRGGDILEAASRIDTEPGAGVRAHVEGHGLVAVGSARWALGDEGESGAKEGVGAAPRGVHAGDPSMRSSHSPAPPSPDTGSHAVVHVSLEGGALGTLELADEVRPEARGAVAALRSLGLAVLMVSGDGAGPCAAAAARLGIAPADVHARVSPAGKAELVARLRAGGARVAVVGDGVNDAAALAAADVGVAMAGGVGAAADVAGVVLLGDSPAQVVDVVRVGRATLRKIRQNLAWAFGYNLIGIPLAAGALLPLTGLALTPSISSAFMGISSLAVMTNSLLLQPEVERLARHGAQDAGRERTAVPDAKELSASQASA